MRGVQVTDAVVHAHVERSHLDNRIVVVANSTLKSLRSSHIIVLVLLCKVEILVDGSDDQIENGNNISGVVLQLSIQAVVKLEHMITVNVQDVLLSLVNLSESLDVEGFTAVVIIRLNLDEGCKEVPQLLLYLTRVDVRAIQHLCRARWLIHVVHTLHPCGGAWCGRLQIIKINEYFFLQAD